MAHRIGRVSVHRFHLSIFMSSRGRATTRRITNGLGAPTCVYQYSLVLLNILTDAKTAPREALSMLDLATRVKR